MALSDLTEMLSRYSGASASAPPPNTVNDFSRVAEQAPQGHLAGGLATAFNSDQTPSFGSMLGSLFSNSNGEQKAGILGKLLGAAGPAFLPQLGLPAGGQITPEQANQISPQQVSEMGEQARQQNPSIVDQASQFYAQHPKLVQGLGAGALALIMSHISQR
ncbi:MAG: hypothetical protein ABJC09_07080 [Terriglobia bacterium]